MISFIENLQQETQVRFTVTLQHDTLDKLYNTLAVRNTDGLYSTVYKNERTLISFKLRVTRNTDKLHSIQ
jgi:hypothetical protein